MVQAIPGHKLIRGNKVKPESFSFPPVANRFFRISTVPELECRGIDSSNTSIRHVTAIVPFICFEFRTFRSQSNQNPDLASFLKWSHNRSNDGTQMDSTLERHHGRLFQIRSQRCDCNQSGQSDTLLNSSLFGQQRQPRKKCWSVDDKITKMGLHFSKALFEGLIFGGAYLRREICVSKSIGLAL